MRRFGALLAALISALIAVAPAGAMSPGTKAIVLLSGVNGQTFPGSTVDDLFTKGLCTNKRIALPCAQQLSTSRASTGLAQWADGHWSSFANNALRMTDQGLLVEEARTNLFLNSAAPVTQTITVVSSSVYTVSVYGTASIALTGATTGTVTQGSPSSFTASTTSLVCTVSGAGGTFQNVNVELGAFATSPILTTGASATRAADIITLQGNALTAALAAKAARTVTNAVLSVPATFFGNSNATTSTRLQTTTTARIQIPSFSAAATLGSGTTSSGIVKSAFGFDGASITVVANGGSQGSTANPWALSGNVYVGNRSTGDIALNGYLRRLTFGNSKGQFDGLTQ